ncbi:prostatic spermine-binding protein-like [Juglans microcarpa x Juglans regia]|uniref:prostatic spermine-binding protein-like n=1 Tax=Juglans microcarpa x Juglans regia TaxID=2249226 RepID=UPI001B7F3E11|nr:prostatic spermine-binding protein-like [Juglans microcarpa x Juglans regia]
MASLQADIPTPVKEVVTKETEETTHDDDQESAAVDQDQDLARKDIEFIATAEETDHKPKEVVLPDDIEEDSEVVADDHEVDKAAVSPIEEDSKWTEKLEHEAEDQDDEDDELE